MLENHAAPAQLANRTRPFMVNSGPEIYLTDFLNRTFAGKNAQKSRFLSRKTLKSIRIHHSNINRIPALLKEHGAAMGLIRLRKPAL
jgi:hypothetical protein